MSIRSQITTDLTNAMKNKDAETLRTLRLVVAAFINLEKSKTKDTQFTDEEYIQILRKEYKTREESISIYEEAGRADTVTELKREMEIIGKYLPAQMNEEQIEEVVRSIITGSADRSTGTVMRAVMAELKGKADGKKVANIVQKLISE
jgi:uncharacterized protein